MITRTNHLSNNNKRKKKMRNKKTGYEKEFTSPSDKGSEFELGNFKQLYKLIPPYNEDDPVHYHAGPKF